MSDNQKKAVITEEDFKKVTSEVMTQVMEDIAEQEGGGMAAMSMGLSAVILFGKLGEKLYPEDKAVTAND